MAVGSSTGGGQPTYETIKATSKRITPMTNLGDMLREAREARGLTWNDVERATHIRLKYLDLLESNRFDELPGDVYTRGFLRNYAIFLELPYADVVAAYETALNPPVRRTLRSAPTAATATAARVSPRSIESGAKPLRPTRALGLCSQPVGRQPGAGGRQRRG